MLFFITESQRPNRLTETKDPDYHVRYGRWVLNGLNHPLHTQWIRKCIVNWSFYKGDQWIFEEDLEAFFQDESGDIRNRLKFNKNLIRPMVEQYVGNAIRLSYKARAKAQSDFVITKREKELARLNFYHKAKDLDPDLARVIDNTVPLGETPEETLEIFENVFTENYEKDINGLLTWIEEHINMEEIKVRATKNMAITGIGIYEGAEYNANYTGDALDPMYHWFDRSAQKPDLSDAEYQGKWYYHDVPSILERWQNISDTDRRMIEQASENDSISVSKVIQNFYNHTGSKIPVYETYWKDTETQWYGWVKDDFGYPFFTRINGKDKDDGTSKYVDKDLIDPPNDAHKEILGNKKKGKIYVDVLRYCIFIPKEELGQRGESTPDIVLEHGVMPYQETYWFDPSNVEFPFKCFTWSYDKGEILSPLDDAINPQRFINRTLSIAESHVNNMRGTGTVIAKNAIDPRDGEESIQRNINKSKTITLDITRTGSVQNSIGTYGTNLGQGTLQLFDIVNNMQQGMQDVTGVNDAMTGTQGGGELVGAIQSQIQRGTLIQEPFYYALTSMLRQAYQHMATVGKRIYFDNPRKLTMMVGDKGMERIKITKDMQLEDFRIKIQREESKESTLDAANNMILTFVQMQLIDQPTAANLFNRATVDEVADGMRTYQISLKTAKDRAARQQGAQQNQLAQAQVAEQELMAEEQGAAQQAELDENERDREHDMDLNIVRGEMQNDREVLRSELKKGEDSDANTKALKENIKKNLNE